MISRRRFGRLKSDVRVSSRSKAELGVKGKTTVKESGEIGGTCNTLSSMPVKLRGLLDPPAKGRITPGAGARTQRVDKTDVRTISHNERVVLRGSMRTNLNCNTTQWQVQKGSSAPRIPARYHWKIEQTRVIHPHLSFSSQEMSEAFSFPYHFKDGKCSPSSSVIPPTAAAADCKLIGRL